MPWKQKSTGPPPWPASETLDAHTLPRSNTAADQQHVLVGDSVFFRLPCQVPYFFIRVCTQEATDIIVCH